MTKDEALKMAIETIRNFKLIDYDMAEKAINACKEALKPNPDCDEACMFQCQMEKKFAQEQLICPECGKPTQQGQCFYGCKQPTQEPVAYMAIDEINGDYMLEKEKDDGIEWTPLYTHPHQWQGLTDNEVDNIYPCAEGVHDFRDIVRAIEQALKEKNKC